VTVDRTGCAPSQEHQVRSSDVLSADLVNMYREGDPDPPRGPPARLSGSSESPLRVSTVRGNLFADAFQGTGISVVRHRIGDSRFVVHLFEDARPQ